MDTIYTRHNIKTGERTVGKFNESHHPCFAYPQNPIDNKIRHIMLELINLWNHQEVYVYHIGCHGEYTIRHLY